MLSYDAESCDERYDERADHPHSAAELSSPGSPSPPSTPDTGGEGAWISVITC